MSRSAPPIVLSVRLKLGVTLGSLGTIAALPVERASWAFLAVPLLFVLARGLRLDLRAMLNAWLSALPFVLGVAGVALFDSHGIRRCSGVLAKASVSVLSLQLLVRSTPVPQLFSALRGLRVPEVFCSTIALLHRYSFVLIEESQRMRRARAGRQLRATRWALWHVLGNSVGLLFVRTVARAERVQAAMRSRGAA